MLRIKSWFDSILLLWILEYINSHSSLQHIVKKVWLLTLKIQYLCNLFRVKYLYASTKLLTVWQSLKIVPFSPVSINCTNNTMSQVYTSSTFGTLITHKKINTWKNEIILITYFQVTELILQSIVTRMHFPCWSLYSLLPIIIPTQYCPLWSLLTITHYDPYSLLPIIIPAHYYPLWPLLTITHYDPYSLLPIIIPTHYYPLWPLLTITHFDPYSLLSIMIPTHYCPLYMI